MAFGIGWICNKGFVDVQEQSTSAAPGCERPLSITPELLPWHGGATHRDSRDSGQE